MEFELVERPRASDVRPLPAQLGEDPKAPERLRRAFPFRTPDWRDQAVIIPDQEYGS
ncbi:MAG: hypothetical protein ACEQR8_10700 [Cypionkella sp.]